MSASDEDFTQLIRLSGGRDPELRARLMRRVYGDLRRMARAKRPRARAGDATPPDPTTIIHEAFLRVFPQGGTAEVRFDGRAHFFGVFARAMEQFIVDWQRARLRQKRGGGRGPSALSGNEAATEGDSSPTPTVQSESEVRWRLLEGLAELGNHAPLAADVVWLRYGHGLSLDETSRELGIAPRTVCKYWNLARAWLRRRLGEGGGGNGDAPVPGSPPDGSSPRTPSLDAALPLPAD
jgi:RNA polymerase sigma factor (TIGR02999 family)